ncbi:Glycosyl transferase, group 2 family protein [Minicystis rosea]|nr:Glycosyl transferase, group 2 family protein [Minicystis rosea]
MLLGAATCLATLGYTYAGYPALIGALAHVAPQKLVEDPSWTPTVTAMIPVYNAASYLRAKIASLQALDYPADKLEILVYCDGATDDTNDVARALAAADPRIRLIVAHDRKGKPEGVNRMLEMATGEVLLMTDVRQRVAPGALRALVSKLADPKVACVSGNLVLEGATGAGAYWIYENWIRRQEGHFRGMVGVTGPLYVIRRADMSNLPGGLILDDMWVPMRHVLDDRTIVFAEDAECFDDAFGDEREYGRKVRTLAGNYQLFALLPGLLDPRRNPVWLEVVSHKILRLACPWALGGLAVSSIAGALTGPLPWRPFFAIVAGGQALFYLAALAGPRAGKLGTLARTFVVLNGAAVNGLFRWAAGTQKVTW